MTYDEIKHKFIDEIGMSEPEWLRVVEFLIIHRSTFANECTYKIPSDDKNYIISVVYDVIGEPVWDYTIEPTYSVAPVKQYNICSVEIDLLTIEEADQINSRYLASDTEWWLKSCGRLVDRPRACSISSSGSVNEGGMGVEINYFGVRPCFRTAYPDTLIGTKILVGDTWATVVLPGVALADYIICRRRFDSKSNDWETSELKAYIKSVEFRHKIMNGDTI